MGWSQIRRQKIDVGLFLYISLYSGECQNQVGWRSNELLLSPARSVTTELGKSQIRRQQIAVGLFLYISLDSGVCQNHVGWRSNEVLLSPAHSITTEVGRSGIRRQQISVGIFLYISPTAPSVRIRWVGEVMRCCWLQPTPSPPNKQIYRQ